MENITVKSATKEDIPSILGLAEELHNLHSPYPFNKTFKRKYLEKILSDSDYYIRIVKSNLVICAYLIARNQYDTINQYKYSHIIEVVVESMYRNTGIGKKVLSDFIEWAKEENVKEISANVLIDNEASKKLFEQDLFTPISTKYIKHF